MITENRLIHWVNEHVHFNRHNKSASRGLSFKCATCHKTKSSDEFHRDAKKLTGFKSTCRSCRAKKWEVYSKTLERDHVEIHKRLRRTQRVDQSPCETGCELFKFCANACQTCAAFRDYTEENRFNQIDIAVEINVC